MRTNVAAGGTFPDYELPDHENVPRKLSEIQGEDPLILTFARGNYCPKEHQQHLELAANYSKIAVAYTKIATISTDTEHDPMIPHTLVLKPKLVIYSIYSIYNGYWFWGRPSFVDLWHDLRAVNREIRPDWDLSKPGLREAWDAGDYSPFHGWDRRSAESMPSSYAS